MKIKELMWLAWQRMTPSQRTLKHRDWLVSQGFDEAADNYSTVADGNGFYSTEDIQHCDHCDEDYAHDCLEEVQISRNRWEMWCENCRDNDAFWCNGSEQWYSCDNYNSIEFDGETYEENNAPDEYSDDCDEGARGLLGYHADTRTRNNWRKYDPTRDLFGVELEMRGTSLPHLECLCDKAHQLKFIPETDGSLREAYSVEIVGYPMPLKDYRRGPWAEFLKVARGRSEGWNAGKGYGIHISIGRTQLSPMEQSKLVRFFTDNRNFCEVVAGRKDGNWAHYRQQRWLVGRTPYTDRYCAVSLRDQSRIEIRAFRSTIDPASFLKNVQFVAACMEFVRENGALDLNVHTFWRFINHKSFANRYRELITHPRVAKYIEQNNFSAI
jgi:hypothetical protein